jgi:hypothetical protein
VGHFLDLGRTAGRTGDELLFRLLLEVLKAWKPALKAVFLFADKVVDHHGK